MVANAAKVPVAQTSKVRTTRVIAAGEFKAKCLALLDEVNQTGQEIEITKRGKPVARLIAPRNKKAVKPVLFGRMKGTAIVLGDIIGPTGEIWDADR